MCKKKIITALLISVIIIGISLFVYADNNYSCDFTISQDKTVIAPGETVTFELKASNIQIGTADFMTFGTFLEGNTDEISDNFKCKADGDEDRVWSVITNLDGDITYIKLNEDESVKSESTVGKIELTANTNIQPGVYTFKFSNIVFYTNDDQEIKIADITKTVEIKASTGGNSSTGDDSTSGGSSSTGNGSTSGGSSTTGNGSTSGGSSSTGNGSTSGGSSSTGNGSTTGGSSSTGNGSTTGGSSSTGNGSTTGGSTSTGSGSTTGGSSSTGSGSTSGSSASTGSSSSSSSATKKTANSSNSKSGLPYAGGTGIFGIILSLIVVSGIAVLSFVKYKRLNI